MHSRTVKKLAILGVIALLVGAFFYFDLGQYLSFSYVKEQQARFIEFYQQNQLTFIVGYFVAYVLIAALSLPGAVPMTLIGGAVFGFWLGVLLVSFASSIGATLACAVARYVAGNWVQRKFADKLTRINQGVEREGAFYLFTLRLIPIFPFFVINLVFGLTRMKLFTFYWVSQVGMLAGTAVYVNAGVQLGQIESPGDILSFELLASFALLGIFPLVAKKAIGWYRARQGKKPVPTSAAHGAAAEPENQKS
jgi:uncharacterized membrane protein YdjX (TVP38/TMEM64 family)